MEHRCANKSTIYSTPGGHYRITRQCRLPLGHVGACTYGRPPSEGASKDLTQLTGDTIKTDLPESRPGIEMSRTVWLEEADNTALERLREKRELLNAVTKFGGKLWALAAVDPTHEFTPEKVDSFRDGLRHLVQRADEGAIQEAFKILHAEGWFERPKYLTQSSSTTPAKCGECGKPFPIDDISGLPLESGWSRTFLAAAGARRKDGWLCPEHTRAMKETLRQLSPRSEAQPCLTDAELMTQLRAIVNQTAGDRAHQLEALRSLLEQHTSSDQNGGES